MDSTEWLMLAFGVLWIFAFGSAVGSFLNVVAYRLPRKLGLVRPSSFCPVCLTPIRWYDNLPVLGWIRLRGQCRTCGVFIPARYPLVEASVGGLYLLLAAVELGTAGANLPGPPDAFDYAMFGRVFSVQPRLLGLFGYHIVLISFLAAWILIRLDEQFPSARFVALAYAVALVPVAVWSHLHPVGLPWQSLAGSPLAGAFQGLAGLAAGGVAGWLTGALANWTAPRHHECAATELCGAACCGAAIGAFLGWQAAIAVAFLATVLSLLAGLGIRRRPVGLSREGEDELTEDRPFVGDVTTGNDSATPDVAEGPACETLYQAAPRPLELWLGAAALIQIICWRWLVW